MTGAREEEVRDASEALVYLGRRPPLSWTHMCTLIEPIAPNLNPIQTLSKP